MKSLVCYKWVLNEADILVDTETKTLKMDKAKPQISEYDRNAIELGATLNEKFGFSVESLTVGTNVSSSTKDLLARGMEKAYYVEAENLDSAAVAKVIAETVKKNGGVDLIICGEGSGDQYSQQVGPRIASLLDYNLLSYVSSFTVEGDVFVAERKLEDGVEKVHAQRPAVVTVLSDINTPRIPTMKQILSAKKKPTEAIAVAELGLDAEQLMSKNIVEHIRPSIQDRKQIRINDGDQSTKEAAQKLVTLLRANKDI